VADVWFDLGNPIQLAPMIPTVAGVATNLPGGIYGNHNGGIYLILNQSYVPSNRYMGITTDFQDRFASRQGSCFELGITQAALNHVMAFLGVVKYRNNGAMMWTAVGGYGNGNLQISLDTQFYDFEHMFIKCVQHAWPFHTVTNTVKTGALNNTSMLHAINMQVTWNNGAWGGMNSQAVTIPAGGNIA
jgi:hypothetical protein